MTLRSLIVTGIVVLLTALTPQTLQALIPQPRKIIYHEAQFEFNRKTQWIVENKEQEAIVRSLSSLFVKTAGFDHTVRTSGKATRNAVILQTDKGLKNEAYSLNITAKNIILKASTSHGFFHGIQTLRQMLPSEINGKTLMPNAKWTVKAASISDSPRFDYRGFMLDVSRFFMPVEDIKRLLDQLAYHKINYFHWHLVDDNGWRIEIKKYPLLTDIGAWKVERHNNFSMRHNPEPGESATVGGYYTQNDIREIVQYAAERYIEVIPEIEMPAHTNSSLAAYPHLTCPVVKNHIGVLPGIGGAHAANIYCAGNDSVFTFLEDVLTEVMTLFPSQYIHIGGDEAAKTNWEKCPLCQARMKDHNIPNEEELQSYFIKRINLFLQKNNKKLMGWDELVDSEIPEGATIFGWRGMGNAAEEAGKKGFKYIKSPAQKYYLLRYQGPQWFEPYTYFGNTTLKDIYQYEPLNTQYPESVTKNMLGVQACLWTEFVNSSGDAEYLIFPRLSAFAESAWSLPENKNWESFVKRIDKMTADYKSAGINFAKSMFNIAHKAEVTDNKVRLTLENIRPDAEIRYTTDKSEPIISSELYRSPFFVNEGTSVRARVFINQQAFGEILALNFLSHKAIGAKVISTEANAGLLTNGLLGSEKRTDGEWVEVYDRDAAFVIDLGQTNTFNSVKISWNINAGMTLHLPTEIKITVSDNGTDFRHIHTQTYSENERFQFGMYRDTKEYLFGKQNARFIKLEIKNPGMTPAGHVRPDTQTRFALDEVIVQ